MPNIGLVTLDLLVVRTFSCFLCPSPSSFLILWFAASIFDSGWLGEGGDGEMYFEVKNVENLMDWICKVKVQEKSKVLWLKQLGGYRDNFYLEKWAESQHVLDS